MVKRLPEPGRARSGGWSHPSGVDGFRGAGASQQHLSDVLPLRPAASRARQLFSHFLAAAPWRFGRCRLRLCCMRAALARATCPASATSRQRSIALMTFLYGQLHRSNVFQHTPKIGLRRDAHGSISVQEGQPTAHEASSINARVVSNLDRSKPGNRVGRD